MLNNFGFAIHNNVGDIEKIHDAIWAVYHCSICNDTEPLQVQHRYCPTDERTWCKYWQSQNDPEIKYSQKSQLPPVFLSKLKPLFERLSSHELLNRCFQDLTQNQNESINCVLWGIFPKMSESNAHIEVLEKERTTVNRDQ